MIRYMGKYALEREGHEGMLIWDKVWFSSGCFNGAGYSDLMWKIYYTNFKVRYWNGKI